MKYVWKFWKELCPIADKIRNGDARELDASKVKTVDCRSLSNSVTLHVWLLDDGEILKKSQQLEHLMKVDAKWGCNGDAEINAVFRNNDGTTWVELLEKVEDTPTVDSFSRFRWFKYADLHAESQGQCKVLIAAYNDLSPVVERRIAAREAERLARRELRRKG